jgi:hypothetical protein
LFGVGTSLADTGGNMKSNLTYIFFIGVVRDFIQIYFSGRRKKKEKSKKNIGKEEKNDDREGEMQQ